MASGPGGRAAGRPGGRAAGGSSHDSHGGAAGGRAAGGSSPAMLMSPVSALAVCLSRECVAPGARDDVVRPHAPAVPWLPPGHVKGELINVP